MDLKEIIMGSIIFIFIGVVIIYLLIFSMKKKQNKWLMAMIILLFVGYLGAVFMTAYKQQYMHSYLTNENSDLIKKHCKDYSLGIKKSNHPFKGWTPFLLENHVVIFLKSKILDNAGCLAAILKANSNVVIKKVIYIYDEEQNQVIYRIEKPQTK